ncbi:hypothetical protein [Rubripirellula reticaptiva]|uniref:Uncharacterized protein n=1 Tax=Rubripirellula reticaptiva TaxID=2528013 RepID=A0A5C6F4M3_9BACT|nr:hypothetical protein [Rubripirellula reticaptiva]TWU56298.1 hypothetical protein Poly59_26020 [Rubripirellula reticaptiva]
MTGLIYLLSGDATLIAMEEAPYDTMDHLPTLGWSGSIAGHSSRNKRKNVTSEYVGEVLGGM